MKVAVQALISTFGVLMVLPVWSDTPPEDSLTVSIAAPAYWCPYACDVADARAGFAVDIARAALESESHRVIYQNLPYDRALMEARNGRIDAVIPAFKAETPEFIFPLHAVSLTEYCFYVSEDDPWRYSGVDSLGHRRFVATSGYSYGVNMDAYISENRGGQVTLIQGSDVPNRLRELVRRERFDALLDDRLLFESSQSSVGLVNAGCLTERHAGYLALSPEDPDRSNAIGRAFERGIINIRKDRQLCDILEKYGLGTEVVPELNGEYCSEA